MKILRKCLFVLLLFSFVCPLAFSWDGDLNPEQESLLKQNLILIKQELLSIKAESLRSQGSLEKLKHLLEMRETLLVDYENKLRLSEEQMNSSLQELEQLNSLLEELQIDLTRQSELLTAASVSLRRRKLGMMILGGLLVIETAIFVGMVTAK